MAEIRFAKMSGAGNDFIIIDNRRNVLPKKINDFVKTICARRVSVGADGLMLIEKSAKAHFKLRYFNSDGSEEAMCGNGARCIARYAYLKKIAPRSMRFETGAYLVEARVTRGGAKIKMGDPKDIRLGLNISIEGKDYEVHHINTGVPHLVHYVEDIENYPVLAIGQRMRYHPSFAPQGVNANFVKVMGDQDLRIRTYERGVEGETLACGTGSVASAIIASLQGKVNPPVSLHTQGGKILKVYFDLQEGKVSCVYLEGEARFIYEGVLNKEAWK